MKNFLTLSAISLLIIQLSAQRVWYPVKVPANANEKGEFHRISAANYNVAWGIVYYGAFYGQSWDFDGSNYGGYIVKTTNGGKTWSRTAKTPGTFSRAQTIQHIAAVDANTAFVTTQDNNDDFSEWKTYLYRTQDGGATWEDVSPPKQEFSWIDMSYFWNAKKGVCIGDDPGDGTNSYEIFTTENGGKTWKRATVSGDEDSPLRTIGYYDIKGTPNGHVYFTSWGNADNPTGYAYYSKDFGKTWKATKSTNNGGDLVAFRNENVGIIAQTDYSEYPFHVKLSRTKNGGRSWEDITPANNAFGPYCIEYIPGTRTLVMTTRATNDNGPFKTLMSIDDGTSWRSIDNQSAIAYFDFIDRVVAFGGVAMTSETVRPQAAIFNSRALFGLYEREDESEVQAYNDLKAYPTLFNDNINIEIKAAEAGDAILELIDVSGKQVSSQKLAVTEGGLSQMSLQTKDISSGLYLLKVRLKDKVLQQKMIKR